MDLGVLMSNKELIQLDIVTDASHGDSAKGVLTAYLAKTKHYTHCLRFSGGSNAGHTVYVDGKKIITHIIPTGVLYGLRSIIGSGCVLNVREFFAELSYLKENGFNVDGKVFIAKNCHIVSEQHIEQEKNETKIGSTKKGIGPCYTDKISRNGIRAEQISELQPYLVDMYKEFYETPGEKIVLCEGTQGFWLDVDLGDYPYVTSTNIGPGAVLNNGFNHRQIRDVYGCIKVYDTYVGSKKFHGEDKIFDKIREVGKEYGSTTGRPRQCNLLNVDKAIQAAKTFGINKLLISKMDIFEELKFFRFLYKGASMDFDNGLAFENSLRRIFTKEGIERVEFSYSPAGNLTF